jgi:hypothetical protein
MESAGGAGPWIIQANTVGLLPTHRLTGRPGGAKAWQRVAFFVRPKYWVSRLYWSFRIATQSVAVRGMRVPGTNCTVLTDPSALKARSWTVLKR